MDLRVATIVELLEASNMVTLIVQSFAEKEAASHENLAIVPVTGIDPLTLCLVSARDFPPNGYITLESYLQAGFSPFGRLIDDAR